ncbi:hypothetical protein ABKJ26_13275 [Exiguobacterium mexicanum]
MEINKKDLRKISRGFRSIANRTINVHYQEFNSILKMFVDYIDSTKLIFDYINSIVVEEIDINKEVSEVTQSYGRAIFATGTNVEEEIVYTYRILKYLNENNIAIQSFGFSYSHSNKYQDMTKGFGYRVILPFVNHIEDYLTEIAIDMGFDEEAKYMINVNSGQAQVNIANDNSTITATQTNNVRGEELDNLVESIKTLLTDDIPQDEKEIINDNVDIVQEELKKDSPKKGFLKAAWSGIESAMEKVPQAVSLIENLVKLRGLVKPFIE